MELTIEQRRARLELAKQNRPNIPNETYQEDVLGFAVQFANFETFCEQGFGSGFESVDNELRLIEKQRLRYPSICSEKYPLHKGCILIDRNTNETYTTFLNKTDRFFDDPEARKLLK